MKHELYRIISVEVVGPHALRLEFDDGTAQTIDFRPVLEGDLFAPLRDPAVFKQVRLDPEAHTVVWPNGADFDPATLHDWTVYEQDWIAPARSWAQVAEGPAEYGDLKDSNNEQ